ncbi:MAG: hypothetical protein P4M11_04895 [Candidatus Pacebacteria bacterium]|nr:hypothetical protein [Candidatus Paceibacterota bacterium]
MSTLKKSLALFAASVAVLAPLSAVHAQTYTGSYGYNPYQNSSYYDNSYYDNNYNGYSYNNNYSYSYQSPTCTISITTPNTYSNTSVSGTLSWTSNYATSAYISSVGPVNTWGSTTVYAYPYQTYTMTVSGPGGTSTCQTAYYPAQQTYYNNYNYSYPSYNTPSYYTQPYNYNYSYNYSYGYNNNSYSNYNPVNYVRQWWHNMGW